MIIATRLHLVSSDSVIITNKKNPNQPCTPRSKENVGSLGMLAVDSPGLHPRVTATTTSNTMLAVESDSPGPHPRVTATTMNFMKGSSETFQEKTTWVQCELTTCLKWRLVDCSLVKLDLKQPWFCHMNPDPAYRSCSVAQDHIPKNVEFVYSPMPAGSLVLANSSSWPKWPAIVCPDPDSGRCVTLHTDGRVKTYHVEFLGKPHTRCWSSFKQVEPYHPFNFREVQLPKGISKRSYALAFEEATRLVHMECKDRLQMCYFLPDELLSDAQALTTEIEHLMKQFKRGPSSHACSCGGAQLKSDGDSDVEEVGDMMNVESFRFVSSPTKQGLNQMSKDVTIIEGVRFESFEGDDLMHVSS